MKQRHSCGIGMIPAELCHLRFSFLEVCSIEEQGKGLISGNEELTKCESVRYAIIETVEIRERENHGF